MTVLLYLAGLGLIVAGLPVDGLAGLGLTLLGLGLTWAGFARTIRKVPPR